MERKKWMKHYHMQCFSCACLLYRSTPTTLKCLYLNQSSYTFTQLTPGALYLISVGAFTDAGEGEREE